MKLLINNITSSIDTPIDEVVNNAVKKIAIKKSDVMSFKIVRRSVDARRGSVCFNYALMFDVSDKCKPNSNAKAMQQETVRELKIGNEKLLHRPVIVGSGPAGLFAAYTLAKNGYRPIVIERGEQIEQRTSLIDSFIKTRKLNENSNIQFGEGGAGTYSDGKLTTRIDDERCNKVLEDFVEFGANEDILYLAKPHIGTDILRNVIVNMRNKIISLGGEFHFNTLVKEINIKNGKLVGVSSDIGQIDCEAVVLATGHSARDTYKMLFDKNISMSPKPFAIGVRIEHLQEFINKVQYGKFAGNAALGAADYRLAYNASDRSCFSFCMCPGGSVVAASSEQGMVVVNGMSNNARDGENANSALVVQVNTNDYDGLLGGIDFQQKYEKMAYDLGENYSAPMQNTIDFLNNKKSNKINNINATYPIGSTSSDLSQCLPSFVTKTLGDGLRFFDKKINGFSQNSVLTGVETRTSAPVRILRGEDMQSINVSGLYPTGEGSGYAGGIMSAAVDGIKVTEKIMQRYMPYSE